MGVGVGEPEGPEGLVEAVAVGLAGEEFEVVLELPAPPPSAGRARGAAAIPPDGNPVGP